MQTAVLIVHILLAITLIVLALLQHGKGADAGAAFGSGASSTMFGARGSANFLSRSTAAVATLFFLTSLTLGYFFAHPAKSESVMDSATPASRVVPEVTDLPPAAAPSSPEIKDGKEQKSDLPSPPKAGK